VARLRALKQRAGALDFVDLLLRARDLLVAHPRVRARSSALHHLFVDEFQDTDPLQRTILLRLSADDPGPDWRSITPEPGSLFIVGDPKQAIYRFRRADVETYRDVCEMLVSRGPNRRTCTPVSGRPRPSSAPSTRFAPHMTGDRATLQAKYEELSPYRADLPGQPAVVALPVPEPYGQRRVAAYAIEKNRSPTPSARSYPGC
jgi:hypothetical protein